MATATAIIDGPPGEVWTNDTSKPMYQLVCSRLNTCGLCYQYHLKISRYWALPLHHNCRCRQVVVKVGQEAPHPFCDYQELVKKLEPPQQAAVMGRSLFRLWTAGVVDWTEAVTPARVRSLQEVVGRQRLSIKAMIKAGVSPAIAKAAHGAVNTPEHQAVVAQRKDLLQKIAAAGVNHQTIVKQIGEQLASRVTIAAGPSYTPKAAPVVPPVAATSTTPAGPTPAPRIAPTPIPGIKAQQLISPTTLRQQHAAELTKILASRPAVQTAIAALSRTPSAPSRPTIDSARPSLDMAGQKASEIREAYNSLSGNWRTTLTGAEKTAIGDYTIGAFEDINRVLRHGDEAYRPWPEQLKKIHSQVEQIDSALARASLDQPVTVYRGLKNLRELGFGPDGPSVGTIFKEKGFLSTSLDPKIAGDFRQKGGAVLRIRAPEDSYGASMAQVSGHSRPEYEVLFARNSTLTVTKVTRDPSSGRLTIDATLNYENR